MAMPQNREFGQRLVMYQAFSRKTDNRRPQPVLPVRLRVLVLLDNV